MKRRAIALSRTALATPVRLLSWALALAVGLACASVQPTPIPDPLSVSVGRITARSLTEPLRSVPLRDRDRMQRLVELFRAAGCGDHLELRPAGHSPHPNVVCTLPGRSGLEIVVGAHFDKPAAGRGIADNWTGLTMLPALYHALALEPRRHTIRFVGFTDVFRDHAGSESYLRRLPADEKAKVRAMVNLKGLGLGSTAVWASKAHPDLRLDLYSVSRALELPLRYVDLGIGTVALRSHDGDDLRGGLLTGRGRNTPSDVKADANTFRRRGVPTIVIHSVTRETRKLFTQPHRDDSLAPVSPRNYYESFRMIAVYLGYLDQTLALREQRSTAAAVGRRPT